MIRRRPTANIFTIDADMYGVKWKLDYGSFSRLSEPYAWCESNPYCPDCSYEMRTEKQGFLFKNYFWLCDRCGESYECPHKSPYDTHEIVAKLIEADIRSGRLQLK